MLESKSTGEVETSSAAHVHKTRTQRVAPAGARGTDMVVPKGSTSVPLDYFTQQQAATYCGVSINHFREQAPLYGIVSFPFMGKLRYRKADLQSVQESAWQQSVNGGRRTN